MYVILSDGETFSIIEKSTLLRDDYTAQFDLEKLVASLTPEHLEAARLPEVSQHAVDEIEES
jgi:hypothetical protein